MGVSIAINLINYLEKNRTRLLSGEKAVKKIKKLLGLRLPKLE